MDQSQRDEMIQKIRAKVVEGSTIANACNELGINYQTYFSWTKKKGNKKVKKTSPVTNTKTVTIPFLTIDLDADYSYQINGNRVVINKQ